MWIEINTAKYAWQMFYVAPFAGVWIEIQYIILIEQIPPSHPSRVCGLKSDGTASISEEESRTLRGCVD